MSPLGPLTQRLVQGLLEENLITPLDDASLMSEAGELLWPLYGIGQVIIFCSCGFYVFFLSFFFVALVSAVGDWMSHDVALERI